MEAAHWLPKNALPLEAGVLQGLGFFLWVLVPLHPGKHHNQFKGSLEVAQGMMCSAGLLIKASEFFTTPGIHKTTSRVKAVLEGPSRELWLRVENNR